MDNSTATWTTVQLHRQQYSYTANSTVTQPTVQIHGQQYSYMDNSTSYTDNSTVIQILAGTQTYSVFRFVHGLVEIVTNLSH